MDIKKAIQEMTLEEKASLLSGRDFWHTKAVKSQKIPEVMVSDGPHGLRKQDQKQDHLGNNDSIKAVCFPAACATASSFDRALLMKMGKAIGVECQAEGIATVLGPAVNIKRSPLCGRNFEYYSEDPFLATEIAGAQIKGVQSKNVGTSIKHFFANNQEYRRLTSSSNIDERTMREIYLAAFEGAVKNAKPWTVMCSYNRINGLHASENKRYLTTVLRDEWGFDGIVMSDWGAVNHRVLGLEAGLDLEMPGSFGVNDREIINAVNDGKLSMKVVDRAVERILKWIDKYESHKDKTIKWDKEADHELAGKIEEECAVLLKNESNILPLDKNDTIAFIGKYAKEPRFQGGGSSHINSFKKTSAMEASSRKGHDIVYAQGYDDKTDTIDRSLITKAVAAAKKSDVAVIFAGLPDSFECEGYDRKHMMMPENQNILIAEVAKVQPNTVVVLHNGSPVEMPWINDVKGILEMYLGGQNVGTAEYNILFGKTNPSGRLAETFPIHMEDNPSFLNFPGERDNVNYREGIFVGYRYYDKKKADVLFPFGHGLSYTTYKYSNMRVSKRKVKDTDGIAVSVDVTNIGRMAGKEVVQLYVGAAGGSAIRPVRELKGFEKISLRAGESKTVSFELGKRAFAYYNEEINDWYAESGEYNIEIAASSRDIRFSKKITVESTAVIEHHFSENSTLDEFTGSPELMKIIQPLIDSFTHSHEEKRETSEAITQEMIDATFGSSPLRSVFGFGEGDFDHEKLAEILKAAEKTAAEKSQSLKKTAEKN